MLQISRKTPSLSPILSFDPQVSLPLRAEAAHTAPHRKTEECEEENCQEELMITDPQEEVIIPVSPSAASLLSEVYPRVGARTVIHHDAMQSILRCPFLPNCRQRRMILFPDSGFEPLTASIAYRHIGEEVIIVVGDERVCQEIPEGVVRNRS